VQGGRIYILYHAAEYIRLLSTLILTCVCKAVAQATVRGKFRMGENTYYTMQQNTYDFLTIILARVCKAVVQATVCDVCRV